MRSDLGKPEIFHDHLRTKMECEGIEMGCVDRGVKRVCTKRIALVPFQKLFWKLPLQPATKGIR